MKNSIPSSRSLSMQWKLVSKALLALTIIFSTIAWSQFQHLKQQQRVQLQTQQDHAQHLIQGLAQAHYHNTLKLSQALAHMVSQDLTYGRIQEAEGRLAHYWRDQRNKALHSDSLSSLSLISPKLSAPLHFGEERVSQTLLDSLDGAHGHSKISCASGRCHQWLAIPIDEIPALHGITAIERPRPTGDLPQAAESSADTASNSLGTIIISRDLEPLRQQLQDSGLVSHLAYRNTQAKPDSAAADIPAWQLYFPSPPEAALLTPLKDMAQHQDYRELVTQPSVNTADPARAWGLLPYPGKAANSLMLLLEYPVDELALTTAMKHILKIYALAICVLALLLSIALRGPIRRLQQQTHLMPLLGQKQFQKIRDDIFENQRAWPDELDLLDQAMCTLTYQLESLEQAVDVRTQEMERLSLFDTLTGLANRHLFQYELQNELQEYKTKQGDQLTAVVLLDLDKFKRINDSLGHQQGDLLLERMGKRLKQTIRSMGLVARLGGDEFALLLRNIKHPQQLDIIGEKIQALVSKPIELHDSSVVVHCSIGISLANLNDSANDLIKHAEIAMYRAKNNGGNSYQRFNPNMATEANEALSLERDIRRGLDEKEFTLFLQPKVNMDGHIQSFEALVRWDHEERGLLPPGEFIPAMESMGFISELDNWMLEITCRQLKVLEGLYPDLSISVNISSTHFTEHSFLTFLQQCLDKYPINPSRLELEITETLLMENMSAGLEVIDKIKELGVRIALDDFGTGYSSLSYLKTLPIDTVKIDREFIKDIPDSESDMQISSVIIFLAKQLHFEVVAEGVETAEQLAFLKASHCDLAQGFYFSKPVAAHKALLMLESERLNQLSGRDAATRKSS